jgi:hypothetical protein
METVLFENEAQLLEQNEQPGNGQMTLIKILRHFAAYTNQKQKHLTYLLKLLKLYEPIPYYSLLPSTGQELMHVNGSDWSTSTNNAQKSRQLPSAVSINDGKYVHFGLENALSGNSAGPIHRDADLMQFVDLYYKNASLLPKNLRKRVNIIFISFTLQCI